ncbi:MAG: holdfast anchoring protein HfaA [Proteobacteria bacterium]|nr:holdfast anchoring protein HfaA [Pseudomonadota bacterium]
MRTISKTFGSKTFGLTALACLLIAGAAQAGDYSNAAEYNHPYGMNAGQENAAVDPSLRDANGNLTVVNGQFTSSSFARSSASASASAFSSGVGIQNHTSSMFGDATAIGNSLNVITVGSWNTVIVNSHQTNTGDVKATVKLKGK